MDLIRASDTRGPAPVQDWHVEDHEPDSGSVTSRLTQECVSAFRRFTKNLPKEGELTPIAFRRLERSCSSLILWDSGYGVAKGGLDDVLDTSRTLRRLTLKHLVNISRVFTDRSSRIQYPYQ